MSAGRPTDYTPELATAICAEIALGYSLTLYWNWADFGNHMVFETANIVLGGLGIFVLCRWTGMQFGMEGLTQLLLKWVIFGAGLAFGFHLFFGLWPWEFGFAISSWSGRSLESPGAGMAVIASTAVLTVSKLSNWLQNVVGMRIWQSTAIQVVRGCF